MTKIDAKKLISYLGSTGKVNFVKYFRWFNDESLSNKQVESKLVNEGFTWKSSETITNRSKIIVREGLAQEAIQIVLNSRVSPDIKQQAKNLLKQLSEPPTHATTVIYPDEIVEPAPHFEGSQKTVTVNRYERNSKARAQCIAHFGSTCSVCELNFRKVYGELGKDFIHVHHILPLSEIKESYEVDPAQDLIPVCPNCHAMLHKKNPPYNVEELREILKENL